MSGAPLLLTAGQLAAAARLSVTATRQRLATVRACEFVVRDEVHAALTELSDNAHRGMPDEAAPTP